MWNNSNKIPATELLLCQPWQLPANSFGGIGDFESLSKYKSEKPTRHIVIHTLNVLIPDYNDLFTELDILGEVKNVDPLSDTAIISYFKIKDAQDAVEYINTNYTSTYKVYYTNSCLPKERLDDRFFISLTLQSGNRFNYMEYLSAIGFIYSVSETFVSSTLRFLLIEYNDIRASEALYEGLNNVTIDGITYQIFKCEDGHSVCNHHSSSPTVGSNIMQSTYSKPNQNHHDVPWDKTFSYFCFNPFSSETDSSSSSAPIIPGFTVSPANSEFLAFSKNGSNTESDLNYRMDNDKLFDETTLQEQPPNGQSSNSGSSKDRPSKKEVLKGRKLRDRPSKNRLPNNKRPKNRQSNVRQSKYKSLKNRSSKDTSKAKSAGQRPSNESDYKEFHHHLYPILLTMLCIFLLFY